jgi:hypothetical protein
MDPTSIATAVTTYVGVKDLMPRLLGPTFDYVGGELRSYTEKGAKNLGRIFRNAGDKLGAEIDQPGQVSPKVLKNILDDGYFTEDELASDYFGGVLASSRSPNNRDDRGAAYAKLIARLSVYQLRMHHVFYMTLRMRYLGVDVNPYDASELGRRLRTFISFEELHRALDMHDDEPFTELLGHALNGLAREALIGDHFAGGGVEDLKKHGDDVKSAGVFIVPALLGIELFMWAYGKGRLAPTTMFSADADFQPLRYVAYPSH